MIMPGVQNPHWRPCFSQNAFWSGWRSPSSPRPSIVVTAAPSACAASIVQLFTARPSRWTVHAPHWLVSQPTWVPVRPRSSRISWTRSRLGSTSTSRAFAVHLERDVQLGHRDDLLPCSGAGLIPGSRLPGWMRGTWPEGLGALRGSRMVAGSRGRLQPGSGAVAGRGPGQPPRASPRVAARSGCGLRPRVEPGIHGILERAGRRGSRRGRGRRARRASAGAERAQQRPVGEADPREPPAVRGGGVAGRPDELRRLVAALAAVARRGPRRRSRARAGAARTRCQLSGPATRSNRNEA